MFLKMFFSVFLLQGLMSKFIELIRSEFSVRFGQFVFVNVFELDIFGIEYLGR